MRLSAAAAALLARLMPPPGLLTSRESVKRPPREPAPAPPRRTLLLPARGLAMPSGDPPPDGAGEASRRRADASEAPGENVIDRSLRCCCCGCGGRVRASGGAAAAAGGPPPLALPPPSPAAASSSSCRSGIVPLRRRAPRSTISRADGALSRPAEAPPRGVDAGTAAVGEPDPDAPPGEPPDLGSASARLSSSLPLGLAPAPLRGPARGLRFAAPAAPANAAASPSAALRASAAAVFMTASLSHRATRSGRKTSCTAASLRLMPDESMCTPASTMCAIVAALPTIWRTPT